MIFNDNGFEEFGCCSFVCSVVGVGLVVMVGLFVIDVVVLVVGIGNEVVEFGQFFYVWVLVFFMGWNSWDVFGVSVIEVEYFDNVCILVECLLFLGYDIVIVDIQWYEVGVMLFWYWFFVLLLLDVNGCFQLVFNCFLSVVGGCGFVLLVVQVYWFGLCFGVYLMCGILC